MKLYHGTSERPAKLAIESGIEPRGRRKGNWRHSVLSRKDAVYLTCAYAMYFAINAQRNNERAAVIEIDTNLLNPWLLAPDEDAMEQINRKRDDLPSDLTMEQRTKHYRKNLHNYTGRGQWEASIAGLGNCCYLDTVPAAAITRIAFIDTKKAPTLSMASMDPSISLLNYRFLGNKYRGLTKWLFGDPLGEDAPVERLELEDIKKLYPTAEGYMLDAMRYDYILPPISERDAIEIVKLR